MSIQIVGLTEHQVELLDQMWAIEEIHDLEHWKSNLDLQDQKQVDLLMQMVVLAAVDDIAVEDTSQAQSILDQFRL